MLLSQSNSHTDPERAACKYKVKTSENCLPLHISYVQAKEAVLGKDRISHKQCEAATSSPNK